jgi:hypothetical protein
LGYFALHLLGISFLPDFVQSTALSIRNFELEKAALSQAASEAHQKTFKFWHGATDEKTL